MSDPNLFGLGTGLIQQFEVAAKTGGQKVVEYVEQLEKASTSVKSQASLTDDNKVYDKLAVGAVNAGFGLGGTLAGFATAAASVTMVGFGTAVVTSAILVPIALSFKKMSANLLIANMTDFPLQVEDIHFDSGEKVSGPAQNLIPPMYISGKSSLTNVGVFRFQKKFGMYGTLGAIKFKPVAPEIPNGFYVGWGVPYLGDNNCAVDVNSKTNAKAFYDFWIDPEDARLTHLSINPHNGIEAYTAISADAETITENDENITMLVIIKNANIVPDWREYPVLDPDFYLYYHDDVRASTNNDATKGMLHWIRHGIAEGRIGSPIFDTKFYLLHPDLQKALGADNYVGAINHWLEHGIGEGRASSPAFDVKYYLQQHADLQQAFGADDYFKALAHWTIHGLSEGRASSPAFDVKYYLQQHADLQQAFGADNYAEAIKHWLRHGIFEGRASSPAFDVKYYLQQNADLQQAFGADNYAEATKHWLRHGISEGRKGTP